MSKKRRLQRKADAACWMATVLFTRSLSGTNGKTGERLRKQQKRLELAFVRDEQAHKELHSFERVTA